MRIGLISDTHGLVRPEALAFLRGTDAIVHAGDIGKPEVLRAFGQIAPVHAIRGNNDSDAWAGDLPDSLAIELAGVRIFVLHDVKTLSQFPPPAGTQVVVCGHSHKPLVAEDARGFVVANPGSAGPRRFKLPVTAALMAVDAHGGFDIRIHDLLPGAARQ